MNRRWMMGVIGILVGLLSVSIHASMTITAQVDKPTVSVSDRLTYQVTVMGSPGGVLPQPVFPDVSAQFDVVGQNRFQTVQMINGSVTMALRYAVQLQPKRVGTVTIPPSYIEVNGTYIKTEAITVTVATGNVAAAMAPVAEQALLTGAVNLVATVSDDSIYVGESVLYTLRLYRNVALDRGAVYEPSRFEGFWTTDLPVPKQPRIVTIQGRRFYEFIVQKTMLTALNSGSKLIQPARLNGRTVYQSNPLSVMVNALPESSRPTIEPAIGDFSMRVDPVSESVSVNTPVTIRVHVTGTGNFKSVTQLQERIPASARFYMANVTQNVSDTIPRSGEKTFEYVLIPNQPGRLTIQPFELWTFNPSTEQYVPVTTPLMTILVHGLASTEPRTNAVSSNVIATESIQVPAYLAVETSSWTARAIMTVLVIGFIVLNGCLLMAWSGPLLIRYWRQRPRNQRRRQIQLAIQSIDQLAQSDNPSSSDLQAVFAVVSDALSVVTGESLTGKSVDDIGRCLSESLSESEQAGFVDALSALQALIYSPTSSPLAQVQAVLVQLSSQLKGMK